jgi:hypothetical protein
MRPNSAVKILLISALLAATPVVAQPPAPPSPEVLHAISKASCPDGARKWEATPLAVATKKLSRRDVGGLTLTDPRLAFLGGLEIASVDPRLGHIAALSSSAEPPGFIAITREGSWITFRIEFSDTMEPIGLQTLASTAILGADGRPVSAAGMKPSSVLEIPAMKSLYLVGFDQPGGIDLFDLGRCGGAARGIDAFHLTPTGSEPVRLTITDYTNVFFAVDHGAEIVTADDSALGYDAILPVRTVAMKPEHLADLPGYRLAALSHSIIIVPEDLLALWRADAAGVPRTRLQQFDLPAFRHFGPDAPALPPRDLLSIAGEDYGVLYSFPYGGDDRTVILLMSGGEDGPDKPVRLLAFMLTEPGAR